MRVIALLVLSGLLQVQCQDVKARSNLRREQSSRALSDCSVRVMVKYANDQGKDVALAHATRMYHDFHGQGLISIEMEEADIEMLMKDPNIVDVEEDHVYQEQGFHERTLTVDDHEHRRLQQKVPYGITMVQADQLNVGPYPVKVCIADTGVARNHPDLTATLLTGASRYSSQMQPLYWNIDARGHGSICAGIVSARNNGYGVRGIGNIPVYVTRALDDKGQARESDIYAAVQQCGSSGAKVISLSLGGNGMSQSFKDLVASLYARGILIVAASGNNGANSVSWPAAMGQVVAVGAVQEDRSRWSGSNYGWQVELAAPGKMVLSTTVNSVGQYVYRYDILRRRKLLNIFSADACACNLSVIIQEPVWQPRMWLALQPWCGATFLSARTRKYGSLSQ